MLSDFWLWLEYLPLAGHIGATWWFPLMESLHVLSITMMLGGILMVDLRVLGLAASRYTVLQVSNELVPWAAVAFIVATFTGLAMFITRASVHIVNPAFQIKLLLIFLAGINIAVFHFQTLRSVTTWNAVQVAPSSARLAAGLSLILWCGVMLAGRWVGHII